MKQRNRLSRSKRARRKRRGIYLLPNILTTGALFFGFLAIIQGNQGNYETAAIAILIATILDGLDGRVARLTQTTSNFGKEYDSLSDVISFGLAPVLVVFFWSLSDFGRVGWLCSFLYVSAAALRLARFNTHSAPDPNYFQGLPCPMAAAFLVTWMWVAETFYSSSDPYITEITMVIVVMLAVAMVSAIPFLSFKNLSVRGQAPFKASVVAVLLIVLISFDPPRVLFFLCAIYLISGPILWFRKRSTKKSVASPEKQKPAKSKSDSNLKP